MPAGPLLAGAIAVGDAASLVVPEGNPTNLVVMSRLGLSPQQFVEHLSVPGLAAALLCALVPLRRLGEPARPVAAALVARDLAGDCRPWARVWAPAAAAAVVLATLLLWATS